jgi:hypothetical protein
MDAVTVLAYSTPLRSSAGKHLARVARRLARSGAFLAVRYDEASRELLFLRVPERIAPSGVARKASSPSRGRRVRRTREQAVYRRKGGERCWWGSIRVLGGGRWSGRIDVPAGRNAAALLTLERKGKGATLLPKDVALVIPEGEADAVLALLDGLFARARGNDTAGRTR